MSTSSSPQQTLLLFSIGPVQDFIAAARTTRDLWSGSYLISYLIGQALAELAKDYGPEAVVFPHTESQPIIQLISTGGAQDVNDALTPSLPNRFLATLPDSMSSDEAEKYAQSLSKIIKEKLKDIGDSVAVHFSTSGKDTFNPSKFDAQVEKLLEIHWLVLPASETDIEAMNTKLPKEMRMPGQIWATRYAYANWLMDGVKSLRAFDAVNAGEWKIGREHNKDTLTGKEEACLIAPDTQDACEALRKKSIPNAQEKSIGANEFLAATTLIKRFWHISYLAKQYPQLKVKDFTMPNTHAIAIHDTSNENDSADDSADGKYLAIIALDGDEMGKWMSGTKLTEHTKGKEELSPEYLAHFSEMLRDFSIEHARDIVETRDGRLLYSGGDDVLAMLPADTAIDCANALRDAFRQECRKLREKHPDLFPVLGDVSCGIAIGHEKSPLQDLVRAAQTAEKTAKNTYNRAACAISLFKRSGEILHWGLKWTDEFGDSEEKSQSSVIKFYNALIASCQKEGPLSGRFPYKLIELISPYLDHSKHEDDIKSDEPETTANGFSESITPIIEIEFTHCLKQHFTGAKDDSQDLLASFKAYWASLDLPDGRNLKDNSMAKVRDLIGLARTVAWICKHQHKPTQSSTTSTSR